MKRHKHHQETEAVRGSADLHKKNGPLSTPIYQTSTFEVTDSEQQLRATHTDMFYTRYGNPTNTVAENAIAELEGADGALLFASGMTAITTTVLALLRAVTTSSRSVIFMAAPRNSSANGCRNTEWKSHLWIPPSTTSMRAPSGQIPGCSTSNRQRTL